MPIIKEGEIDRINKLAWIAVRAAEDLIKKEKSGSEKYVFALKFISLHVKGNNELCEGAVRAAYYHMGKK